MSNRVEELEMTVSELESTVRGLTDELVETKERLRALEAEFDVDAADVVGESSPSSSGEAPEEPEPADNNEIAEAASEADKSDESDSENNEEEEEQTLGDDIIVA